MILSGIRKMQPNKPKTFKQDNKSILEHNASQDGENMSSLPEHEDINNTMTISDDQEIRFFSPWVHRIPSGNIAWKR